MTELVELVYLQGVREGISRFIGDYIGDIKQGWVYRIDLEV